MWTIKNKMTAFHTKWFRIIEQTMTTPSGIDHNFYLHEDPDSALCVCITEDNRIILEKQYRPAIGKISLDYPAGGMEPHDKTIKQTIVRELREETGYKPLWIKKIATLDKNPAFSTGKIHIFLAKGVLKGKPQQEPTENITITFVKPSEILSLISSGKMSCTFCVSATLFAFRELGFIFSDQAL